MKTRVMLVLLILACMSFSTSWAQYVPKEERKKPQTEPTKTPVPTKEKKQMPNKKDKGGESLKDRLIFGGSVWLQLGNITRIDLFPSLGYKVTDKTILGVGAQYQYLSARYNIGTFRVDVAESYYGWRVFSQQFFSDFVPIFIMAELEATNGNFYDFDVFDYRRQWIYSPLIGGGYQQPTGGKLGTGGFIQILYNLNYNENFSQYASPWITRVGFAF